MSLKAICMKAIEERVRIYPHGAADAFLELKNIEDEIRKAYEIPHFVGDYKVSPVNETFFAACLVWLVVRSIRRG